MGNVVTADVVTRTVVSKVDLVAVPSTWNCLYLFPELVEEERMCEVFNRNKCEFANTNFELYKCLRYYMRCRIVVEIDFEGCTLGLLRENDSKCCNAMIPFL